MPSLFPFVRARRFLQSTPCTDKPKTYPTKLYGRCCGRSNVKGSATTASFDAVQLRFGKAKNKPATTVPTARVTGNVTKQIVFTGVAGKRGLVLEIDTGNMEPDVEQAQLDRWIEVSHEKAEWGGGGVKGGRGHGGVRWVGGGKKGCTQLCKAVVE